MRPGKESGIILRPAGATKDSKWVSDVMWVILLKIMLAAGWRRTRWGRRGEPVGWLAWSSRTELELQKRGRKARHWL